MNGATASPTAQSPQAPADPPTRFRVRAAGALVAAAALAAYHNSFSGPFIFDDLTSICGNPSLRHLAHALKPPDSIGTTATGRPVLNLTLALNYAWTGPAVWSYHLVNLAIHLGASLLLFGFIRRTLLLPALRARFGQASLPVACLAALLWAVHPLQTESVTYVIQRAESLAGFFCLLAFYCFVRGVSSTTEPTEKSHALLRAPGGRNAWHLLSFISCLLGVATKETVAAAPLLVLLYDRAFVAGSFAAALRARWRWHLALAATWLPLAWLVLASHGRAGTAGFGGEIGAWSYLLTQGTAILHYLRLVAWPAPLVLDYGKAVVDDFGRALPGLLIVGVLAAAAAAAIVRRPALGFCGAWFFAILAPSSSIIPVSTQTMAEHRMYLPSAAVILLCVLGLHRLLGRRAWIPLAAVAVCLAAVSANRNITYRSEVSIWRDTVAKNPGNARAWGALGCALMNEGRSSEAASVFEQALPLSPRDPAMHLGYGSVLAKLGRAAPAAAQFEEALRLAPPADGLPDPVSFDAHINLGNVLCEQGRIPDALRELQAALRLRDDSFEAHYNLANALYRGGDAAAALPQYARAIELEPDSVEARSNLAVALLRLGRAAEASAESEALIRRNPGVAEAHFNRGNARLALGQPEEALASFEEAARINPGFAAAHAAAGRLLLQAGRAEAGIRHFGEAVRAQPDLIDERIALADILTQSGRFAEAAGHYAAAVACGEVPAAAHNNYGIALAQLGRLREARGQFARAVSLDPNSAEARENLARADASLAEQGPAR